MAGVQFFGIHREWEDWLGMTLGIVIGASPWLTGQPEPVGVVWNAIIVGALVLALSILELASLQRWQQALEVVCGLWLITSPFNLVYGGALATWHLVLGALVILLAMVELWQDWNASDSELARHGQ